MDEEVIDWVYNWALSDGYKKSREDFVKLIQTDNDVFGWAYDFAKKDGYKKDENEFGVLVGRGATKPVAATTPASTEPVATTEPVKELRNEPMATVKPTAEPTVDMTKMPVAEVKVVEAKPEPLKEIATETIKSDIESQLLPVTEKTEVKAIETPSEKMVIKSEPKVEPTVQEQKIGPIEQPKMEVKEVKTEQPKMKVKGKPKPEPIKIETIKVESDKGPTTVDVPNFAIPEPRKKYKPYGEKGPDVYYSEEYDQYIIKDGDNKTVVNKGSDKYGEIDKKIGESAKSVKEGEGKCDPDLGGSCSKTNLMLSNYLELNKDNYVSGWRLSYEAALVEELNNRKRFFDRDGESLWRAYYDEEGKDEGYKTYGNLLFGGEDPPKSDRFTVYKPFGNDKTLVYDKESGIILKQLDDKAPNVDLSDTSTVYDVKGNIVREGKDRKKIYQDYRSKNPNEGLTMWQGIELDHPEYKELKSLIDGISYKKEKGVKNTFVPSIPSTIPSLTPDWATPTTNNTVVKEVPAATEKMVIKSEPKVEEPKVEAKNEMPSYDDLGINTEKDPGAFLGATFDKNIKYEKLSVDDIIEKGILETRGRNIKLERNTSLRYPDPPGTVFKKEKVGDREVYSSYDEKNKKWYIYDENSNKDNWTEVTAGPVKTLLNSKFIQEGNKAIQSKVDYNSDEEESKIEKAKEGIMLNKYLPYIMKNYDNLSEAQKTEIKKQLKSYSMLIRKTLEPNDPNLDFWLDVNDKFLNNQAISSNAISFIQKDHNTYPSERMKVSELNSNIKGGNIKVLKSIAGDIFYDNKNDVFYYGESFDRSDLKRETTQISEGEQDSQGRNIYKNAPAEAFLKVIKKGTPAYDKIKKSLEKYNK